MERRIYRPLADVEPDDESELEEIYVVEAVAIEPDESSAGISEDDDIDTMRMQIEQTRADMGDTIDAIKEKLNPQHLMQQAKESVREATVGRAQEAMSKAMDATRSAVGNAVDTTKEALGSAMDSTKEAVGGMMESARPVVSHAVDTVQDVTGGFAATIRENPIPAALAATGLVWLALSARSRASQSRYDQPRYNDLAGYDSFPADTGEPGWSSTSGQPGWRDMPPMKPAEEPSGGMSAMIGQAQDKVGAVVDQAQDKMGAMVDQAQEKAGAMMDQARQKASMVANTVQDRTSQWADQAQVQAKQAVDTVQQTFWQTPMAIGAVALAVGAMIGFAIPSTPQEQQMMGEARDQLMGKAQEAVQDVKEKVQNVAQEVMGTAKETAQEAAQEQGLTS